MTDADDDVDLDDSDDSDDSEDTDYGEDADYSDDDGAASTIKKNTSLKWGLIAVSVLGVVAIVLVAVVLLGGNSDPDAANRSADSSRDTAAGISSAHDTGPVAVIIDDPSCAGWSAISSNLATTLSLLGHGNWITRDQSIPVSAWDDELKKGYMAAGQVVRSAAAQTVGLVKLTPHRVMRELYEQFIAYSRTFVERIPNYAPGDASLAGTAVSTASALAAICGAIANGSAAARGPLVESQSPPTKTAPPGNPTNPQRYLTTVNSVCTEWQATLTKFGSDTAEWQGLDPSVPSMYWNPQQKAVNLSVAPVMISYANKLQQLGRRSANPVLQDFADLSAQYRRAFAVALPTYSPSDNDLANAASYLSTTILGGCTAVAPSR